jgi:hypothetical protein
VKIGVSTSSQAHLIENQLQGEHACGAGVLRGPREPVVTEMADLNAVIGAG